MVIKLEQVIVTLISINLIVFVRLNDPKKEKRKKERRVETNVFILVKPLNSHFFQLEP